jgi:hypothetical protein
MTEIKVHGSNSAEQSKFESGIITKLKEKFEGIEFPTEYFEPKKDRGIKFQVDFYNIEKKIFGEIYVCKFPLKSGHLRKIKGDILKLLTIEKILGDPIQKYMVLTIESENNKNKILESKDLEKNLFGEKSWFSETIALFKINMLYYTLSKEEAENLKEVRKRQKEGMKT